MLGEGLLAPFLTERSCIYQAGVWLASHHGKWLASVRYVRHLIRTDKSCSCRSMTAQFYKFPRAALVARGLLAGVLLGIMLLLMSAGPAGAEPSKKDNPSGLPLPRFVSLKADKVRVRQGPGPDHKVAWVYQSVGLPVEVIQEFETWRRVRDSDGTTGWVFQTMLSGRRTVIVLPWDVKDGKRTNAALRSDDSSQANIVAHVEPGAIGAVRACDGAWCEVTFDRISGYIEQKKLWGVYPGEKLR
jgi:SH3-like domain-containing protein